FVVRLDTFRDIYEDIKSSSMEYPEQHYLIEGQRGMGKTTLLLRLSYEIRRDPALNTWLIPIVFKEEEYYRVNRLFKLWESTAQYLEDDDEVFEGLYEQMDALYQEGLENERYEEKIFDLLTQKLESTGKKLILFIDNMGEMFSQFENQDQRKNGQSLQSHRLREILNTCPHIRIIGASSVVMELFFDYSKPFYEFFKVKRLEGLDYKETQDLLLQLASYYQQEEAMRSILDRQKGRVEALRSISQGVIRTVVLLFEIFLDDQKGNALKDLEAILDRVTPLYKHRLDDLNKLHPDLQNIADALALNWDAMSPEEIAKKTRLSLEELPNLLRALEKSYIISRVPTDSRFELYQIKERFFNIWYLMRQGRKNQKSTVRWLVRFLEMWYDEAGIKVKAQRIMQSIKAGTYYHKSAYAMTEALVATGMLEKEIEHKMIVTTRAYLSDKAPDLASNLSESDLDYFEKGKSLMDEEKNEEAIKFFSQIRKKDVVTCFYLGLLYADQGQFEQAETYYLRAIEKEDWDALFNLGLLYHNQGQFEQAETYYLRAIEKEDRDAL
ncbi:MAG: tetratricopeptide repeat protein, partial [Bacteroidota bacterium]